MTPEEAAALVIPQGKTAPCNRACRYAYPGEEAVFCAKHKLNGMVDVVNPSCKVRSTHGLFNGSGGSISRSSSSDGSSSSVAGRGGRSGSSAVVAVVVPVVVVAVVQCQPA